MPSPIAHWSLAAALWPPLSRRAAALPRWRRAALLLGLLGALVAPDLDILADPIAGRPWFEHHGGAAHSLAAAALFGVIFALACRAVAPLRLGGLWAIGAAAYGSHVLLDACTRGRGVALLWPFSAERLGLPVPLFMGVRHGPGEWERWDLHAGMVASELAFGAVVWLLVRWARTRGRRGGAPPHACAAVVEGA